MEQLQFIQQHFAWVIAVLSLGLGVYGLWLAKRRSQKNLSYRIVHHPPLVTKREETEGTIEIFYNKRPVESVRIVVVEFFSLGGKEIEAKDFAEPLQIRFDAGTELFEVNVYEHFPASLKPEVTVEKEIVTIKPMLFNTGDRFSVKIVLAEKKQPSINLTSRISGVSDLTFYDMETTRRLNEIYISSISLVSAIVGLFASRLHPAVGPICLSVCLTSVLFGKRIATLLDWRRPRKK